MVSFNYFFLNISVLLLLVSFHACSRDPGKFEQEIALFEQNATQDENSQQITLFTGSSSIRMWTGLQEIFPAYHVVNTGFGGSQMTDLLFYSDRIVIPYHPAQIFIYEGDNDIAEGKKAEEIMATTRQLVKSLKRNLPHSRIFFISAKPSPARWTLKDEFILFNNELKQFADEQALVYYINIWTPMLNGEGNLRPELYLDDMLHMNEKGYAIWTVAIKKYLTD